MKTKSLLATLVLSAGLFSITANAQTDQTAPVTVNIDLTAPVISIDLGADPTVNFLYATAADYTVAQTQPKVGHFTVISNQNYDITVAAQAEFTVYPAQTAVPLSVVQVSVDPATANGGTLTMQPLSMTPGELVSDATATTGATYNVNYSIPDAAPLLGKANEVYTTTVIYTATQL